MRNFLALTRRACLGTLPGLLFSAARAEKAAADTPNGLAVALPPEANLRRRRRGLLDAVRAWGCQFQNADVARIAASGLDLIVVDHALGESEIVAAARDDIERLKAKPGGGRRLVLAYLSVGEAEDYRPYWQNSWKKSPPSWLGPANPAWPGAYTVRFWEPAWKDIVFKGEESILAHIRKAGFDGVFLDRVDGYSDWEPKRPAAPFEMIDLVSELASLARTGAPDFLVVGQNSEPLLRQERYRDLIDGVSKESLLYGLSAPEAPNSEGDIAWSLAGLNAAHRDGIPVFAIEYLDDAGKITAARSTLQRMGFVPFFANRALDRMPEG